MAYFGNYFGLYFGNYFGEITLDDSGGAHLKAPARRAFIDVILPHEDDEEVMMMAMALLTAIRRRH